MNPTGVTIKYWNCRGLTQAKLEFISETIAQDMAAVFVIAEHWFSCHDDMRLSPCFVKSSPRPRVRKTVGHENGGLAIFASPKIRHVFNDINATEFSITFKLDGKLFSSVYLPPRLSPMETLTILHSLPGQTHTLFGDINVRFGKAARDARTWNLDRGREMLGWFHARGLEIILCDSACSRNDHVFSSSHIPWSYHLPRDPALDSDHGIMTLSLPDSRFSTTSSPKRFSFSLLREPIIQKQARDHWTANGSRNMAAVLGRVVNGRTQMDVDLVDRIYDMFELELSNLCYDIFPQYSVQDVKSRLMTKSIDPLGASDISTSQVTRLFKRSQRLDATLNPIKPRDSSSTALTEGYSHYSKLYGERDARFQEDPKPPVRVVVDEDILLDLGTTRELILKYPVHKSGGPDNFDGRLLHCLAKSDSFLTTIMQLFNLFFRQGTTPKAWNVSLIHLLLKDIEQPYPDKTRPIALTNILRRLFEKAALKKWLNEDWSTLHPSQAGFRRGFSTTSHILLSDEMSRRGFPVSVFLDLQAAFDKVPHSRLLEILEAKGCPTHCLGLIYSLMMRECSSFLTVNQERHPEKISRLHGVFQGSILSPFLFNIFIDELAHELSRGRFVTQSLLYADDIALKATNWKDAQQLVAVCEKWAFENGMTWGIGKCGVLGLKRPLHLANATLPIVNSYKYLGVPHGAKGVQWELLMEKQHTQVTRMLLSLMIRRRGWTLPTRLLIYKTFIRSTVEYCRPLLMQWICQQPMQKKTHLLQSVSAVHKLGVEFVMGKDRPRCLLESMSGLGSWECRSKLLHSSLAKSLKRMHCSNPLLPYYNMSALFNGSDSILHGCSDDPLEREYEIWCQSGRLTRRSWPTFCRSYTVSSCLREPGLLQHYIRPRARNRGLVDACLVQTPQIKDQCLKWRTNRMFIHRICPQCMEPFNRAHVSRCGLLHPNLIAKMNEPRYIRDVAEIHQEIDSKTQTVKYEYVVLDYMLNNQDFDTFSKAVAELDCLLLKYPQS